jgi:hypothetical protein
VLLGKAAPGGKGTGTFGEATDFAVGTTPNCVAVGDFNGDGNQDLVTVNSNASSHNVSILLGTGTGKFNPATPRDYAVGFQPRSVAVRDFNGDQKLDLVVTNENSGTVSVLLGDGAGSFPLRTDLPVGSSPYWVTVGDFSDPSGGNFDGKPDIAVTTRTTDSKVRVFLNDTPPNGTPVFLAANPFAVVNDPLSVTVGDFNGLNGEGDGKQDLATANAAVGTGNGNVSVLVNTTLTGLNFTALSPFPAGTSPQSVAVGQFDDLSQDLVLANNASSTVSILLNKNDGTGGFLPPKNFFVGTSPSSVAVGDFNGDGRQDLAVANFGSDGVSILLRPPCPCAATFAENFDVPASLPPALPPGWTAAAGGWVTSKIDPDTVPNDAFVAGPATVSDKSLFTPIIAITSPSAQLSFRNNYCLEDTFDGGVLEIAFSDGPFTDIITAGGSFVTGGYNATINPAFNSPIAGRMAWSGNSCCYICTVVNLPAAANGQSIRLRFRMASDSSVASTGWRIDKVQVSNGNGSICCSTGPATTILGSVSTRALVGPGDNAGIGGFIIMGSEPKRVLLRGIGPSLTQFGVPNALGDPVLELHGPNGFATITNNNWKDTQEAELQATGISPANDLESAIVATLDPGAYSAVVRGNSNTSGVALVEVYDLDLAASSTLANISTRAFVGTGNSIMIAGLTVLNGDFDRIVIRGIGPSLTAFGVPGALANPTLELRDANGALLVANNDWQDDPAQAAELTDAGLAPTNNLESGIAATLPPGPYTALLAGLNNGTGVGLVEVYDLDATDPTMTSFARCGGGAAAPP